MKIVVIWIITVAHKGELRVRMEYADREVIAVIISVVYSWKLCVCVEHLKTE